MKFALKDIRPNPFRSIGKYPTVKAKIESIKKSITQTGFWDNIVARLGVDGTPELGYGHTRLAALRELFPPEHKIELIIKKFSDAKMIQVLHSENNDDYSHDFFTLLGDVRVAVQALGEGKITSEEMPLSGKKTNEQYLRYAPSFVPGRVSEEDSSSHPYTAQTLAVFLELTMPDGTPQEKLEAALNVLELEERKITTPETFRGKSADKILDMTRSLKKEHVLRVERLEKARLDAKALQEKQSALDAQRREQEKKDREIEQARLREVAAAKLEKDKAELAELEAEKKRNFERSQKRYAEIQEKRKVLDAKVEENNQRQEAFKPKPEAEIRVQGVSALRIKFDNVYSDSHGLTQEAVAMGRNQSLTPEERETLRQAMLKAGERLRYGSEIFLPPGVARMATKALREKAAKGNAEKFFKSNKGDKK